MIATGCDGLDNEQLVQIAKQYERLEKLELYLFNVVITDIGIEKMVGAAKNLRYLRVDEAINMTMDLVTRLKIDYQDLDVEINND